MPILELLDKQIQRQQEIDLSAITQQNLARQDVNSQNRFYPAAQLAAKFRILVIAVCWLNLLASGLFADGPFTEFQDPFAFDGTKNILQEEHFGIANGKLTTGIRYLNACGIAGIWAPPYVSSDFKLDCTILGERVPTQHYTWHPRYVTRTGSVQGINVETVTLLSASDRAGMLVIRLSNLGDQARQIDLKIAVSGTLDIAGPADPLGRKGWSFATPASQTATVRRPVQDGMILEQGELAIVLRSDQGMIWNDAQPAGQGIVGVPAGKSATVHIVIGIGPRRDTEQTCHQMIEAPEASIRAAQQAYQRQITDFFDRLPRLESNNRQLQDFYYRSLVPLIMNRWDVPEFVLHPYYSTGSVNGGCVGNYLWDFGGNWEIFPLLDPEATKSHIRQFLKIDTTKHFAFDPTTGIAFGPWYPVNQEKITGLIYYYVKQTGDLPFLAEIVEGKTILQHVVSNALYGDDLGKAVSLIDYGPSNSHLELRRGFPYNHVMPDLNARRYDSYLRAAELKELVGEPMPELRQRAEDLKALLKSELWNPQARWFEFQNATGKKQLRYTCQMFKLFNSQVLDQEQETGLLSHLQNEREFLAEYGMESMSKTDIAYDPVDYDNGGGGCFTAFPAAIAERLYKAGHAQVAEDILQRTLWWGEHTPYWGDSFAANEIEYRRDTPLQCTIDSAVAAQCLIFGMLGVTADFNGDLTINPRPPRFASRISLSNLRLRGHVLKIEVEGTTYVVSVGNESLRSAVGTPIRVKQGTLTIRD